MPVRLRIFAFGASSFVNVSISPAVSCTRTGLLSASAIFARRLTSGTGTGEFARIVVMVTMEGWRIFTAVTRMVFLPGVAPNVMVVRALPVISVMTFEADRRPPPAVTVNVTGTPENLKPRSSCTATMTGRDPPATPCVPEIFTSFVGVRRSTVTVVPCACKAGICV